MADSKITALTSISTSTDPANDPLVIVDVSDTSMAATGTTKKVTLNQLLGASGTATLASATITGAATVGSDLTLNGNENYVYLSSNYSIGNNSRVRFRAVGAGGGSGYGGDFRISTRATNNTWNTDVLTIDSSANCIWTDGAGGTRMTLNSTGLGVATTTYSGTKLTVLGVSYFSGGASSTEQIRLGYTDGTSYWSIGRDNATTGNLLIGNGSTRLTIDASGNVGIGVAPSAWSIYKGLQVGYASLAGYAGFDTVVGANMYFDGTNFKYIASLGASSYRQIAAGHQWFTAASGTAGTTITDFATAKMTLDASGNLILLSSNTPATLTTNGQLTVNATSNTNLRFSYRGSDGVTRVANITLA